MVGKEQSRGARQSESASEEWDALKGDFDDMADAAISRGRHFTEIARMQVADFANRRKDGAAQSVADVATSLREATHSFDDRPDIRAVVDTAAEGLEQFADSIRSRSLNDMLADLEDIAQRHPTMTAVLSVTAGFMAARFIKSTSVERRRSAPIPSP
ncbi:hypothetical protein [Microvirga terricola]|uniref:Uncharacterized protein n=1 Tax=Microvirga terricola TaxID=2719797 RepID=A0ABX0VCP9_9HYPH|nr:hypothetical protein [Microvirga terricola]NIX76141.1 hypothetical protein [Microvirga terricola]